MQPGSRLYRCELQLALPRHCPEPVARAALQALVRRHAILRTHYAWGAGEVSFVQVVLPADGFIVPLTVVCCGVVEWSGRASAVLGGPLEVMREPLGRLRLTQRL